MTDDRSLERAARSWLETGPTEAPDRVVEAALLQIQTTSQERDLRVPWRFPKMTILARVAAGAFLFAAAVGGLSLAIGERSGGPGGGGVPTPVATLPPAPTPSSSPVSSASPTASPNEAACRLATSDEVEAVTGNPGLGATPRAGGTAAAPTCVYTSGGQDIQARISLTRPGGSAAFLATRGTSGLQTVSDLGVDARFDPATRTLYVLKGDAMVAIIPSFQADTDELRLSQAKALARLVLPRL